MKFEVIENPGNEWDKFVDLHTDIIFFRSVWGSVLKEGLGAELHYCCLREKREIVGGSPGIILKRGNVRLFYSSIHYGGYIGDKRYSELFYGELVNHLKSPGIRVDMEFFLPALFDSIPPQNGNMKREKTAITSLDIDAKTLREIEMGFCRGVRQSLRKAEKLGLEFKVCSEKERMDKAFSLYKETMKRNKAIVRYPADWFEVIRRTLVEKGMADLCMVLYKGIPISSVIVLYSGEGMHLINHGSSTQYLRLRMSDFMQYEIIKLALAKQKKYIDFMHSSPNDKKLIQWKEKFGSRTEYRDNFTLVNSRLKYLYWNAVKKIYPLLSRLFSNPY